VRRFIRYIWEEAFALLRFDALSAARPEGKLLSTGHPGSDISSPSNNTYFEAVSNFLKNMFKHSKSASLVLFYQFELRGSIDRCFAKYALGKLSAPWDQFTSQLVYG
jgi:hypothetical protein